MPQLFFNESDIPRLRERMNDKRFTVIWDGLLDTAKVLCKSGSLLQSDDTFMIYYYARERLSSLALVALLTEEPRYLSTLQALCLDLAERDLDFWIGPDYPNRSRYIMHKGEKLFSGDLNGEYAPPELMITENGYASYETTDRYGRIMDYDRIDYLYQHIEQCIMVREEGVPLSSYYVWCFLDDLEWTGGYASRMGLVRVDYETQQRIIKESGHWYKRIIKNRRLMD